MSELIVRAGSWNSINSAEVESFLAQIATLLGMTEKRLDFLNQVHNDIYGSYTPDEYYKQACSALSAFPPSMVLHHIMKDCDANHKKQLKIWYQELLTMEPLDKVHATFKMLLSPISNTINNF